MFTCPAGKVLKFWYIKREPKADYRIYPCADCEGCHHFGLCTTSKRGRSIWRRLVDEKTKAMRSKLDSQEGKAIYAKRRHIVEPVFAHIKNVLGFTGKYISLCRLR